MAGLGLVLLLAIFLIPSPRVTHAQDYQDSNFTVILYPKADVSVCLMDAYQGQPFTNTCVFLESQVFETWNLTWDKAQTDYAGNSAFRLQNQGTGKFLRHGLLEVGAPVTSAADTEAEPESYLWVFGQFSEFDMATVRPIQNVDLNLDVTERGNVQLWTWRGEEQAAGQLWYFITGETFY